MAPPTAPNYSAQTGTPPLKPSTPLRKMGIQPSTPVSWTFT